MTRAVRDPSKLVLRPLSGAEIRPAYPLIQQAVPALSLQTWMRFARRLASDRPAARDGVVIARWTDQAYPCGLVYWQNGFDLELGPVLTAQHLVAVDILDAAPVLAALSEELESIAAKAGRVAVRSLVRAGASDVSRGLIAAGHQVRGTILCKAVQAAVYDGTGPAPRTDRSQA